MLIEPEPVPIGIPLIVPTRDELVVPLALATQLAWISVIVINPPSRLAVPTDVAAVVVPVVGSTTQLAFNAVTTPTARFSEAIVSTSPGGQVACGVFGIVINPLACNANASATAETTTVTTAVPAPPSSSVIRTSTWCTPTAVNVWLIAHVPDPGDSVTVPAAIGVP